MAISTHNGLADQSLGESAKRVSEAISELLRKEAELGKVEVADKARVMAMGAGLVVGAAVVGFAALGAITAAAILALATTIPSWLAALIVGLVLVALAGVLGLVGVKRLRRATPPVPAETVDSVKEDIEWVKTSAKSGMR